MSSYVYLLSNNNPNSVHLQERLEGELTKYGYRSIKSEYLPGLELFDEMSRQIRRADLIIADIAENSANLFFELGIAFASKKPLILLVNKRANVRIPSELSGHIFIPYDDVFSRELIPSILNIIRHTRA